MREQIYTADSELAHPRRLWVEACWDLFRARDLTWRFFLRSIRSRYRKSYFGYLWFLFPALTTTLTFMLLKNQGVLRLHESSAVEHYPAYVFLGTILWQLFCDSLQSPLRLVKEFGGLMTKLKFPHEALILSGVIEAGVEFLVRYLIFMIFFTVLSQSFALGFFLAPVAAFFLLVLGLGLGVLLVPLGILYSDVERGVGLVLGLWFFLTPIVYSPVINDHAWVFIANPVTPLLISARELFFAQVLTMPLGFLLVSVSSLILLIAGWILYRVATPIVIERMG